MTSTAKFNKKLLFRGRVNYIKRLGDKETYPFIISIAFYYYFKQY